MATPDDFEFVSDLELLPHDELIDLIRWNKAVELLEGAS